MRPLPLVASPTPSKETVLVSPPMITDTRRRQDRLLFTACFLLLVLASSSSCRRSSHQTAESATPTKGCQLDIIHPDKSPRSAEFLAWLKPHAEQMLDDFADRADEHLDIYIADVDNDGKDEYVVPIHAGSGNYLYMWIFRRAGKEWTLAKDVPFGEFLKDGHDYGNPLMKESQLLARFCGKTLVSFEGGDRPNSYPVSYVWEAGKAHVLCDTPWLQYQRRVFHELFERKLYDEAHGLLDGVESLCTSVADPETWLWMQHDLALAASRIESYNDCLDRIAAAEKSPAFGKADTTLRKALSDDRALCTSAKAKAAAATVTTYDFSWLKSEAKRNPEMQIVMDRRFDGLLSAIVPEATLDGKNLRDALKLSIWLPEPTTLIDDRYVVLRGCEPHNCGNKGFVWIDTTTRQAIIMTGDTLASKTTSASNIPPEFWKQADDVAGWSPSDTIDYVDSSGKTKTIKVH